MATSAVCALLESDALETCSLSASISDARGQYLAVNTVCASLLGIDPEALEDVSDATLSPREFAKVLHANHQRALQTTEIVETVEWVLDRVGRRRVAACRFALIGHDGEPWGVCRVDAGVEHAGTALREAERLRAVAIGRSAPPAGSVAFAPAAPELADVTRERDAAAALAEALAAEASALRDDRLRVAAEIERLSAELSALREERGDASAATQRLQAEVESATRDRDAAVARADALVAEAAALRDERGDASAETRRLQDELDAATARAEALTAEAAALREDRENASAETQRLQAELTTVREHASGASIESRRLTAELATATRECHAATERARTLAVEAASARADAERSTAELTALRAEHGNTSAQARRLATELATATRERHAATERATTLAVEVASARAELERLTRPAPAPEPTPTRPPLAAALRELTRVATAQSDVAGILRAVATPLGRDLGWDAAAAWPITGPGRPMACAGAWSDPAAGLDVFTTSSWRAAISAGQGHTGTVATTGRPVWLTALSADDPCPRIAAAARAGLATAAIARIDGPGGPVGVIEVFSRTQRAHEPELLEALTTAADLLGAVASLVARSVQPQWGSRR